MNLKLYIFCVAAVLALVVPAAAADNSTAKVYGGVYSSDTFEPLDNAVVDINSTPAQSMVAKSGIYSFELEPGNYSITAKYYQNSTLTYSATEAITVNKRGSYRLDLLLLPVYSEALMESSAVNLSSNNSTYGVENPETVAVVNKTNASNGVTGSGQIRIRINPSMVSYLLIALAIFLILALGYSISKKYKKMEKNEPLKEKMDHMTEYSARAVNLPEFKEKTRDKIIDPEVSEGFNVSIEETASVTEPESNISLIKPVVESELKVHAAELADSGSAEESKNNSSEETTYDSEIEISAPKKKLPLPADLQEVMDVIRGHGGRITQKDLRSRLKYSEGKVSLMLADLERRDLIEKFKRGRGNVVILKDKES